MQPAQRDLDSGFRPDPVYAHRLGDIFGVLRPHIFVAQRQLGLDLLVDAPGDANPSAPGQAIQPGRDVDTVAVNAFSVDDDIPKIDAHAKLHPSLDREGRVPDAELSLEGHCTLHGIYDAGKLRQQVIPWRIDDTTSVLLH